MANDSLDHSDSALNLTLCDSLFESLDKAQALIDVATAESFSDCHASIVHKYLWALDEFVTRARTFSEQLCKECLQSNSSARKAD